ncbi:type II toxin-antitoxin system prevent-host-death family antitoxin [Nocardioides nanhaiensis]|uniref:Antitoxin n=1 Tax=Nocardioides nanhaiensis TaxID=1476871 RepID=A0ABP8W9I7_9ACTN
MRTISQRELRNDNASVVREVEAGESFVVTRRGVPVARLVPIAASSDLRCDRPARQLPRYAERPRVRADEATADVLEDMRGER